MMKNSNIFKLTISFIIIIVLVAFAYSIYLGANKEKNNNAKSDEIIWVDETERTIKQDSLDEIKARELLDNMKIALATNYTKQCVSLYHKIKLYYPNSKFMIEANEIYEAITNRRKNNTESQKQNVFKFRSTETDVEAPGQAVYTKYEVAYHTFDYNKKVVIFESKKSNGETTIIRYPMRSSYKDGVTYVIVVNQKGMSEIWFSPVVSNLGYDLANGTRLACYQISRIY